MTPLRVYVGYDPKEAIAFHVLSHSILSRASAPVAIIPLVQGQLRKQGIYTRERHPSESTEFSLTRFLVPYLSGYEGLSIFMDCDMLCLADIHELVALVKASPTAKTVWCVQHNYAPKTTTKMGGLPQTAYPRKNWSSLMVFDNAILTPVYVNKASALDLHRFAWVVDREIGSIPLKWNWLVGEYGHDGDGWEMENGMYTGNQGDPPTILHYTLGGPWLGQPEEAEPWFNELWAMGCSRVRGGVEIDGKLFEVEYPGEG